MNYRAKLLTCLFAVCPILAGLVPARAEFIIDDFSAPAAVQVPVIALLNPDPTLIENVDAGILGGERDLLLDVIGAPKFSSFIGETGAGSFVYRGGSPGTAATLQYDGVDADVVGPPAALVNSHGLGGIDLTVYGDRFALDFLSLDGGNSQFTEIWITVFSPGGVSDLLVDLIPDSAVPFTYTSAPFLGWVVNADPTNVTALDFGLNPIGIADVDFELDKISIVPEPSAIVLCGMGLVCLLGCAWRRRK